MPRPCLAALLLPLLVVLAPAQSADPARLVSISLTDAGVALATSRLDLDVAARAPARSGAGLQLDVVAHDSDLAALDRADIPYVVVIPDMTAHYTARLTQPGTPGAAGGIEAGSAGSSVSPAFTQGSMGGFYTFDEVVSILDQLRASHPSIISARQSLGSSIENRELWAVKISDNPELDENEPEVRFDALHHAREPMSMHAMVWFMLWILDGYGNDPLATYLVNEREIWCVPVVNPDGYVYNQVNDPNGGGLWRKNRRDNNFLGSFGVDLNRNYPFQWGFSNDGSSSDPFSNVYRGTGAASEPEAAAMVAFIDSRSFATALSIHSYSNLWLSPWGYDYFAPPNIAQYDEVAALATAISGYVAGVASLVLYEANGVTMDYDHGAHGTLAWTPEIGNHDDGFWPPTNRMLPLAEENLPALQTTALAAGADVRSTGTTRTEIGNGDGLFDAGESIGIELTIRNSGLAATSSPVVVSITSASPWVTSSVPSHDLGIVAAFSSADNIGSPVELAIVPGTPGGTEIAYTVSLTYEGYVQSVDDSVTVEARDVWVDLGGGTSGVAGIPALTMSGPLTASSSVSLDLVDAAPSALGFLFISFSSTPTPFLGGTLHSFPFDDLVILGTDGAGEIHGSAFFPGAASGQGLWFQLAFEDLSVATFGASLSNGVEGTVP